MKEEYDFRLRRNTLGYLFYDVHLFGNIQVNGIEEKDPKINELVVTPSGKLIGYHNHIEAYMAWKKGE